MVRVHDEGSEFDAPIDTIWKYLSDPVHGPAHKDRRNTERKPIGENAIELSGEVLFRGEWVRHRVRNTLLPPLGIATEHLEGPFAGSKVLIFYTPRGAKTGVTVIGEYVSKTLPAGEVEAAARQTLERVFEDDNAALKHYTPKD